MNQFALLGPYCTVLRALLSTPTIGTVLHNKAIAPYSHYRNPTAQDCMHCSLLPLSELYSTRLHALLPTPTIGTLQHKTACIAPYSRYRNSTAQDCMHCSLLPLSELYSTRLHALLPTPAIGTPQPNAAWITSTLVRSLNTWCQLTCRLLNNININQYYPLLLLVDMLSQSKYMFTLAHLSSIIYVIDVDNGHITQM